MKRGTNSDKGRSSRCLLLLFILGISPFGIASTAAFHIVRPSPNNQGVGTDTYDIGKFVYKDQIVDVTCHSIENKCKCNEGGTFVFIIRSDGILSPQCISSFNQLYGCDFHFGNSYIIAVNIPIRNGTSLGTVKYNYNQLGSISSIGDISFWNMTWHNVPVSLFYHDNKKLKWKLSGDQVSQYKGCLLKINITASDQSSSTSGCLLLKIPGTRTYPLTRYRSQVTSYRVTPTTSMASTQMQSPIIHVSSTATVIQSLAATSSSSSLFDHRTMSASSERFKIGSLTPSISSVVQSLSTFDMSIKSVSSAYHRSQPHSLNVRSIASSSHAVIYSSWIKQRSNVQSTKPTPSSNQGVMKSTAVLTASSEPFHTLGRSASFKSTLDLVSKSSAVLSSVIQNGNAVDTSKQSGDDVPVIVGSLFGSLFGVVAIVMVTFLCRRKYFQKENITKQDKLQLQLSGESYNRNGSLSGSVLQKIDNPAYDESIDLSIHTSTERSMHLYDSASDGISNGNQIPEQVYSEVDEFQEPIYREIENDEPIYKEVIEEGPIPEEKDVEYQSLDDTMVEKPGAYEALNFKSDSSRPQSPIYQIVEAENGHSN